MRSPHVLAMRQAIADHGGNLLEPKVVKMPPSRGPFTNVLVERYSVPYQDLFVLPRREP